LLKTGDFLEQIKAIKEVAMDRKKANTSDKGFTRRTFLRGLAGIGLCGATVPLLLPRRGIAQTNEITMWHWETPPQRVKVHETIAAEFKKETGITLKHVPINFPEYQQRMLAAIAAKDLPDMMQVNPPTFMTLFAHQAIVPITDIFKDIHSRVNFFEGTYRDYIHNNENWGIPVFGVTWPFLYRQDLFQAMGMPGGPKTWSDLLKAAKELTKEGIYGMGLPVSTNGNYGSQCVWGFLRTHGGAIVDCQGGAERIIFNSQRTVETYRFLADLAQYSPPGKENWAWAEGELMLKTGKVAAAVYNGAWLREADAKAPELAGKYRYAPMPIGDKDDKSLNCGYPRNIAVTRAVKEKGKTELVKTWLNWLTQPDHHASYLFMEPGLFMPVSEASSRSKVWTENPMNKKYAPLIKGQVEAMTTISTIGFENGCRSSKAGAYEGSFLLGAVLQKIVINKMSPQEAVAWGQSEYEKILRR
jgi:multiple sugar transport system substrate-binding protein